MMSQKRAAVVLDEVARVEVRRKQLEEELDLIKSKAKEMKREANAALVAIGSTNWKYEYTDSEGNEKKLTVYRRMNRFVQIERDYLEDVVNAMKKCTVFGDVFNPDKVNQQKLRSLGLALLDEKPQAFGVSPEVRSMFSDGLMIKVGTDETVSIRDTHSTQGRFA